MRNIFSGIARLWREFRKRRQYAKQIAPENIARMAQELAHLADLACCHAEISEPESRHLQALRQEMQQLADMTGRPEFCRLSADRRMALHDSLCRSQEKLLTSIQSTHAPTARIQ